MAVIINLLDIFLGHSIIGLDWIMLHLHVNNIATWNLHSGPEQLIFTEEKTIKGNIKIVKIHHLLSGYKCTSQQFYIQWQVICLMFWVMRNLFLRNWFFSQEFHLKHYCYCRLYNLFWPSKWHICMYCLQNLQNDILACIVCKD